MNRKIILATIFAVAALFGGAAIAGMPLADYISQDTLSTIGSFGGIAFAFGTVTVAEQITQFEAKRAANMGRMEQIMSKATEEGRSLDQAEEQEYDTLKLEVEAVDKHIARLKDHEKLQVAAATPVTRAVGADPDAASAARGGEPSPASQPFITVRANIEKGIAFTRFVKAMVNSMFNPQLALMYAQTQRGWKDQTPQVIEALRVKANVAANSTSEAGGGAELVYNQNLAGEFIDLVRPLTIIGRIPNFRRVPFNVRVGSLTSGSTAYWVGQGKPIPVSRIGTGEVTLGDAKAGGLVVMPKELLKQSSPSAELLVRDDLVKVNVEFLDENFIAPDYAAVANVNPASITHGVVPTAATGTALANLRTDVQTLLRSFIDNEVPLMGLVWVMHPNTALAISLMQNALGQQEFPQMTMYGGTFFGLPCIASEKSKQVGSPVSGEGQLMVLLNAAEIMLADDGQVDVEASDQASLQMLDNPTNDVTTPTATTMVSMWQTDSVALRAIRHINWAKRRANIVQYVKDAAYVG